MAFALQEILGYTTLMKAIEAVKDGVPNPLPKGFFNVTEQVNGKSALLTRTYGQRQLANRVEYGAPAVGRDQKKIDTIPVKLLHFYNYLDFDPVLLMQLRALDAYTLNMGKQIVANEVRRVGVTQMNTRIAAVFSALVNGIIYYNSSGYLQTTSSGAALTLDLGVPANNKNQLNGLIDGNWNVPSTNIPKQIHNIKFQAMKDTGHPIKMALYGVNVPSYLFVNEFVKDSLVRSGSPNLEYLKSGEIPDGTLGIDKWIPIYEAFYEDASGTNVNLVDGDKVIFCPEPSSDWYSYVEGSYPVPTTIDVQTDAMASLNSLSYEYGMFAYAIMQHNPVGIRMLHGDTFIPWFSNPNAIYQADCVA